VGIVQRSNEGIGFGVDSLRILDFLTRVGL